MAQEKYGLVLAILSLGLGACFFEGKNSTPSFLVKNEEKGKFEILRSEVFLADQMGGFPSKSFKKKNKEEVGYEIILTAQKGPLVVNGVSTQASDLVRVGRDAIIGYNTAGSTFAGGIQIVENFHKDSTGKKDSVALVMSQSFEGLEVNALFVKRGKVYVGGSVDPKVSNGRSSFIGVIDLKRVRSDEGRQKAFEDFEKTISYYGSYGVTAIAARGNELFVTIGAEDGGLLQLNINTLDSINFWPRGDVRSMIKKRADLYILAGTTDTDEVNAGLFEHDIKKDNFKQIHNFLTFGSDYHRAELNLLDDKWILAALGKEGYRIWDSDSDNFDVKWERPVSDTAGYAVSANGMDTDKELLFLAMGEWGIQVIKLPNQDFTGSNELGALSYLGQSSDGQNWSANHLIYEKKRLLVASGSGGIKIYDLQELEP